MTVQQEGIKFAGDYQLIDVKLGSARGVIFDIFNFVVDIQIYEDMFSPSITGQIRLNDAQDLINLMPMIGEEKLLITFKSPTMSDNAGLFEQAFYVYKMTERDYTAERAIGYTLHFTSFETVRDINSKLSKGYAGNINTLVENFLKGDLSTEREVFAEPTKNSITYISNYWSPFANINYLAKRSISQKTGSANFVFFQNNRGFQFKSIDSLLEQDSLTRYIHDNSKRTPSGSNSSVRDVGADLQRITDVRVNVGFDYFRRLESGMHKARLITHELVTKTYNVQTLTYEDNYKEHNHLNPFPLVVGAPAKTLATVDVQPRAMETFNNFKSDNMKDWYLKNNMQMAEIGAFSMDLTIPGRSDLCVGDIVDVYFYRPTPIGQKDQEETIIDKTFSGRYLVSALCHDLNREKHEIHMTVVKDSFIIDLTKEGTK